MCGVSQQALIDSGAQISTITKELCDQLGLITRIRTTMKSIRAVNDDIVKGIGEFYTNIQCADHEPIRATLLVIGECKYPLILSVDSLRRMGALCLDYSTGKLH